SANPPKYITKEFMTLDEILDEEGIKNIPTISDYMNTRMSSILEESKKQGIISEEKYLELKDKNDYQSFKEAFGSFYQGSLGEYQYIMGTEDLKWHSAKKFADGVMTAIGVVVLAASVLTLGPLSLPLVLGIGTSVVSIYSVGKASYEFFTEKDWLTGRPLDDQEKWTAGLQAVASMVTLGRGVGLVSGALAKSDSASTLVKSTASFFNSSTVQNVTRVSDYALDLGTGFVSYKYGGKSINEVLWSTGFALGMNAAIDFGTYKNNKIAKTKMGDIDQAKTNMGEIDLAKMSDEDLMKYLKENNLSFSDLMSIEDDVIRYNKWTQQVSAGLSMEDRIKINGWNYSPDTDLYLKYKGVYDNPDYFNQLTGDVIYPGMNGNIHTNGFYYGVSMNGSLDEGMIIDRFGGIYGNYTSPDGMPFEQRALPPFSEGAEYHRYKVLVSFEVEMGPIAPWFNQPGLGTQYLSDYTIEELLDLGWIVEVFD
ncbi:MAG: TNT domain-containing protein, partial [Erysipelothrix sp.]